MTSRQFRAKCECCCKNQRKNQHFQLVKFDHIDVYICNKDYQLLYRFCKKLKQVEALFDHQRVHFVQFPGTTYIFNTENFFLIEEYCDNLRTIAVKS